MRHEKFNFKVGREKLSALKLLDARHQASMLFLHGGGSSNKERYLWLAEALLNEGIGSVSLDFSGHGESSGTVKSSSLAQRIREARGALEYTTPPRAVFGSSMGAHTAIQLTKELPIQTLILFNPAVYTSKAQEVYFTEEFTTLIRRPHSWRDSDALETLEDFKGNLLIVIGEDDKVIPPEVIKLLDKHSPNVKKKEIMRLPNCTHNLHLCFSENPTAKDKMINTVVGMIKEEKKEL